MVTGYEAVYRSVERGTRSSSNSSSVSVALETHRAAR
jgi:hypothetical protein